MSGLQLWLGRQLGRIEFPAVVQACAYGRFQKRDWWVIFQVSLNSKLQERPV